MADDTDEEEGPAVELGEGEPVEGAPLARVASRLTWAIERSEVVRKEGDAVVRTPDGPREMAAVMDDVEESYFADRQEFLDAVRDAIGRGPVATTEE